MPHQDEIIGVRHCGCVCGRRGQPQDPLGRPHKPPTIAVSLYAAPGTAETLAEVRTHYLAARKAEKILKTCLGMSRIDFFGTDAISQIRKQRSGEAK